MSASPDEYIAGVMARVRELRADPAEMAKVRADVDRAPLPPADALTLLRATGCPIVRKARETAA